MELKELYDIYLSSSGISIDSRSIVARNIFFAIKGENFDGHKFVQKALDSGAILAVVDDPKFSQEKTVLVENTVETLQDLARFHREQVGFRKVIGITGSNGKTTSKELLYSILKRKYKVYATAGNLNNHLGVPLTILRHQSKHELAIIEMGANKIGDIKELCEIAKIDVGFITNIGRAHLEGFGGILGVVKAKTEMYRYLDRQGGLVFIDPDEPSLKGLKPEGLLSHDSFPQLKILNETPFLTMEYIDRSGNQHRIDSRITGRYNLQNMRYAIAVSEYFEVAPEDIVEGIATYTPSNNRSEIRAIDKARIILDAYNANPDSMMASIKNIAAQGDGLKYLFLGDMLELGEDSIALHQGIISEAMEHTFEKVFLYGSEFKNCDIPNEFEHYESIELLKEEFEKLLNQESWILIKGSRGMKLERLLESD